MDKRRKRRFRNSHLGIAINPTRFHGGTANPAMRGHFVQPLPQGDWANASPQRPRGVALAASFGETQRHPGAGQRWEIVRLHHRLPSSRNWKLIDIECKKYFAQSRRLSCAIVCVLVNYLLRLPRMAKLCCLTSFAARVLAAWSKIDQFTPKPSIIKGERRLELIV
jgi:hypothetical protein